MANWIVIAVSVFMVATGLTGVATPARLARFVRRWQSRSMLWAAAALRIVFGAALWFAAPASRAPLALQILGAITVIAGVVLPIMGFERYQAVLLWWLRQGALFVRTWMFAAAAFGLFLLWAVVT